MGLIFTFIFSAIAGYFIVEFLLNDYMSPTMAVIFISLMLLYFMFSCFIDRIVKAIESTVPQEEECEEELNY